MADQYRSGGLSQFQARNHPRRNILTISLHAQRPDLEIYTPQHAFKQEDNLILCSDGLWGCVTDAQIQAVVTERPPRQAVEKLVSLANINQGPDYISVIIAQYTRG